MLGSNLVITGAKYKAPDVIDYVDIVDGNTKIRLIDENSASGDVDLEDNKEVTITTNGETVINPSTGKDAMKKVTATINVPVPVLETNKTATIDASTYTEAVEITPTEGKDAMEKATITITNIPELQANKEVTIDGLSQVSPMEITPTSGNDAMEKVTLTINKNFATSVTIPGFTATDNTTTETVHFIAVSNATGNPLVISNDHIEDVATYFLVCLEDHIIYRKDSITTMPNSAITADYEEATWDLDSSTDVLTITLTDTTTKNYLDFTPASIALGTVLAAASPAPVTP